MDIKIDTNVFLDDFDAEARAHIEKIEKAFLDAAALASDPGLINDVFRAAHSIKGAASFLALEKIVSVAHTLESVFTLVKDGELAVDDELAETVFMSVDCLKNLVDHIHADEDIDITDVVNKLKSYSAAPEGASLVEVETDVKIPFNRANKDTLALLKSAVSRGQKIYYADISFNRGLGKYYKNPKGLLDDITSIGEIEEAIVGGSVTLRREDASFTEKIAAELSARDTATLDLLFSSVLDRNLIAVALEMNKKNIHLLPKELFFKPKPKTPERDTEKPDPPPAHKNNFSVRLDISAINGLLDMANEMILTRNRLLSALDGYEKNINGLVPILSDMSRLSAEIQEKVMLTRMQPIGLLFDRFPRIIHDTARELGKEMEVVISGADVTLDKYLLDALSDPITQIVKNSADHGLEYADRRLELDKPAKGKITLNAFMRDGNAVIEITDDGAGIDGESLRRKALERGLCTQKQLDAMTESETFGLMFEPGISTAKKVSNLSGRGVGMDIVKTNIESLNGSIEIISERDKGTTVRLKMPLTLSVVRTLIVTIDGVPYAVPEMNVERIVRVKDDHRVERLGGTRVLILGERVIPLATMADIDGGRNGSAPPVDVCAHGSMKCLVLKTSGKNFALLIDDAVNSVQTLVKPLPECLKVCRCYSNVTVLGSGEAIAVLDVEGILRLLKLDTAALDAAGVRPAEESASSDDESQLIIFKCSGPELFAVDIAAVSRVENISAASVQEIGKNLFANVADETVRLIRPENCAPVAVKAYDAEKLCIIRLKGAAVPMGLLAEKVIDKVSGVFATDDKQLRGKFIYGTSKWNEKILIRLNQQKIISNEKKVRS